MTKDDKSKDAPAADAKATPELNITKGKVMCYQSFLKMSYIKDVT